jgi:hypothetical protein
MPACQFGANIKEFAIGENPAGEPGNPPLAGGVHDLGRPLPHSGLGLTTPVTVWIGISAWNVARLQLRRAERIGGRRACRRALRRVRLRPSGPSECFSVLRVERSDTPAIVTRLTGLICNREGAAGHEQNENSHCAGLHREAPPFLPRYCALNTALDGHPSLYRKIWIPAAGPGEPIGK